MRVREYYDSEDGIVREHTGEERAVPKNENFECGNELYTNELSQEPICIIREIVPVDITKGFLCVATAALAASSVIALIKTLRGNS